MAAMSAFPLLGAVSSASGVEAGVKESDMYGLIGKFTAAEDKRDELISYLLEGLRDMPGCLSYVVARDPEDDVTIWVTEVWDSAENHLGSLKLPHVQAAIAKARPIIAGMERLAETDVVGGVGL